MAVLNFVACCTYDEGIEHFGGGDTPQEAFDEFIQSGKFQEYRDSLCLLQSYPVDIYVYSVTPIDEAEPGRDYYPDEWDWVLNERLLTVSRTGE